MSLKLGKRVAAATAVGLLTVAVSPVASGSAPGPRVEFAEPVTVDLHNTCVFPGIGTLPVTAGVTARFPAVVPVSQGIEAKDVSVRLGFPPETVTALREAGVPSLAGTASLNLHARHADGQQTAQIRADIPGQPLPAGDLTVAMPGEMDPIGTTGAGELVLALGQPELLLTLVAAQDTKRDVSAPLGAPCVVDPEQNTELATVLVTAPDDGSPTAPSSPDSDEPGTSSAPPGPSSGPATRSTPDTPPRTAGEASNVCGAEVPDDAIQLPRRAFYNIVVTAGIKKLNTETVFGPPGYLGADTWVWLRRNPATGKIVYCNGLKGYLWLPSTRDAFVTFRFVPTSALINVTQDKPAEGAIDPTDSFIFRGSATVQMRLSDVRIHGTPLAVGPDCGVEFTVDLVSEPGKWNPATGGVIEAVYTIPEFVNCGVEESLDTIFTNLVSGPDNHMKIEFGPIKGCADQPEPPPVCKPEGEDR